LHDGFGHRALVAQVRHLGGLGRGFDTG
jgi:hypothetical protein